MFSFQILVGSGRFTVRPVRVSGWGELCDPVFDIGAVSVFEVVDCALNAGRYVVESFGRDLVAPGLVF